GAHLQMGAANGARLWADREVGPWFAHVAARRIPMRFPGIRVIALLGGLAVAGCGASNINHGGGTGGNGGTGGSGGSGDNNCGEMNFNLMKGGTPDLLIVQDRSGSMADPAMSGGTGSKWASVTAAIEQVVGQVNTVDWGLMFFGPDGFASCTVSSTPQVACGTNTSMAINTAINGTMPSTSTP